MLSGFTSIRITIVLVLLFVVTHIQCNVEGIEPGQCLSKFDYDYKVMQKLFQIETQMTGMTEQIESLKNMNKVFDAKISSQSQEIEDLKNSKKDQQVAFMAEMSRSMINPSVGTTVLFDAVHVNVGNNYKPEKGTFVAPVSGTYSVTVSATVERGPRSGHQLHLHLMHDSKQIGYVFLDDNSHWPLLRTISAVVEMNSGDTLFVKIARRDGSGTLVGCCFHTHFSGFLIGSN